MREEASSAEFKYSHVLLLAERHLGVFSMEQFD